MRARALSKISWVNRWSWMVSASSAASVSRLSEARPICFCDSAISSVITWIFEVSSSIRASRSFSFCCRLDILWSPVCVSSLLVANSSMHQSRIFTSSDCCALSSAMSLSISSFTLVKASISADAARSASWAELLPPAAFRSRAATRIRCAASWLEDSWRNEVASTNFWPSTKPFVVFSKFAKDSSLLRILIASCTAEISSRRLAMRVSNSLSDSEHLALRSAKNCWSMPSCSSVASSSLVSWAAFSPSCATCTSMSSTSFLAAEISSNFAAFKSSNSWAALSSAFWASLRLDSKSAFICFSIPKI
mmetsp:Transcript_108551/g.283146  ORF Transcript_108551/g.283146 Transcript_108551/m.283146 type:complete len:306 (+) Transcript_108551:579-1496(+)